MKIFIKISVSLFTVFFVYFLMWYMWGNYARNSTVNLIQKNFKDKISYDKIKLTGFPFNLRYSIRGLNCYLNNDTVIKFPEIKITSTLLIKNLNINLNNPVEIFQKDKVPFSINFIDGAYISVKLYSSVLSLIATSNRFDLTDISTIKYSDYGYSFINTKLKEKIFISNSNSIKISSFINPTNEYTLRITSLLNGRGSLYLDKDKIQGQNSLNTDIIVISNYNKDAYINNMTLNFIKCTLSSDHYNINISGNMNYKRYFGFNGLVNVEINDLPKFLDFLKYFLQQREMQKTNDILNAMNEIGADKSNNVEFRISGTENNLMWGKLQDHAFTKMLLH